MKILFDAGTPAPLAWFLRGHEDRGARTAWQLEGACLGSTMSGETPGHSTWTPRPAASFRVPLPYIFQGLGKGLLFHGAVGVPGVTRKYKLIMIALGGQRLGHVLIGHYPVVHVVAQSIRIEIVPVADFHPDAQRLGRAVGDEVFMELPRAVGSLWVRRPLLVYVSARVSENAVI